jgi:hypothetical protein
MSVTPLVTEQIIDMDHARMAYIDSLRSHIAKLREELRISEIVLHWTIKSLSHKDEEMQKLDVLLQQIRDESTNADSSNSSSNSSKLPPVRQLLTREQLDNIQRSLLEDKHDHDK